MIIARKPLAVKGTDLSPVIDRMTGGHDASLTVSEQHGGRDFLQDE